MGVNRVDYGGDTLIDLTEDTVTAETLLSGYTAHGADGELVTGTAEAGGGIKVTTKSLTSNATSIAFTGLPAQPKAFMLIATTQITLATTYYVTAVSFGGATTYGTYVRKGSGSSSAYHYASSSYFSWTYEDGTLTIRTQSSTYGGYFKSSVTYRLTYLY